MCFVFKTPKLYKLFIFNSYLIYCARCIAHNNTPRPNKEYFGPVLNKTTRKYIGQNGKSGAAGAQKVNLVLSANLVLSVNLVLTVPSGSTGESGSVP
jgi:hypothetical protein